MESRSATAADWLKGIEVKHSYPRSAGIVGVADGEALVKDATSAETLAQASVVLAVAVAVMLALTVRVMLGTVPVTESGFGWRDGLYHVGSGCAGV